MKQGMFVWFLGQTADDTRRKCEYVYWQGRTPHIWFSESEEFWSNKLGENRARNRSPNNSLGIYGVGEEIVPVRHRIFH